MTVMIIKDAVQILILTVFFYLFYISIARNGAGKILRSMFVYLSLFLLSEIFSLTVLNDILNLLLVPAVVFYCVLYQPELRRAFTPTFSKRSRFFRLGTSQMSADHIDSIISACQRLVQERRGALIVFPRKVSIKEIIESGTKVNADISTAIIVTVFDHDTPLHDGAMIIQGPKILAAGCYLPLSSRTEIRQSFGTRHRAALGLADESDAVVIVVSEETGAMSLAYNGNIYYQLEPEVLKNTLLSLLNDMDMGTDKQEITHETQVR